MNGLILLYLSLRRIGQMYQDNLNLLLIDALRGVTRMNHMPK